MKELLKKFIPSWLLDAYHKILSSLASFWYGYPTEKLIVIGVTGTNGKSTVVNLIAAILEEAGYKVGLTSTVNFKVGSWEQLNPLKMTMPGRFFLQRMLKKMVNEGFRYAVIESTSEGVLQYRHQHIHYDVMVFTNLAPEHLERHGGFENYKQAKLELFRHLERLAVKFIAGKKIPRVIVANGDDPHASEFLNFEVDKKYRFSFNQNFPLTASLVKRGRREFFVQADEVVINEKGSTFTVEGKNFSIPLLGKFNIENCLAAIAVAQSQGVAPEICSQALEKIKNIPGRMERIEEGQLFQVLVDYAPEPNSLKALYETIASWPRKKLIHVLGSTGGGRDRARRAVLGKMAGQTADVVIVTNEDPYDDDPQEIIDDVGAGALSSGKTLGYNLFKILDRRQAIRKTVSMSEPQDLVLITGKGAEQAIAVGGGRKIPWDDRRVVREELRKFLSQ